MKNAPGRVGARLLPTGRGANVDKQDLSVTLIGEKLSDVKEGQRHQDVEDPVGPGGAGITGAAGPHRVDLRVHGPRHGAHP